MLEMNSLEGSSAAGFKSPSGSHGDCGTVSHDNLGSTRALLSGDEAAHNQARAFILCAEGHSSTGNAGTAAESPRPLSSDHMVTFQEIPNIIL
ncbi:hypothetical protein MRX96_025438 [Rhipicephalus microplus]